MLMPQQVQEVMDKQEKPLANGIDHDGEVKNKEPRFIAMSTIEPENVDWLWPGYIPMGKVTTKDGDPGVGKSTAARKVAASVSRGEPLPGDTLSRKPGHVLLISCEDGLADTVRPQLDRMGADCSKIVVPNPKLGAPNLLSPSFIESAVKDVGPALVIIDPVIAYTGRRNTDKAGEVREFLNPLMVLAEKYGFAALIVRHFNKQGGVKALYRGSGSIDWMAACRSALMIVEDPEEPARRILAQVKNSLGPKAPSLSFYIDENGFRWGEVCDATADDLLASNTGGTKPRESVQMDRAKEFLQTALRDGPVSSVQLEEEADKLGLRRAIWRAKKEMNIRACKSEGGKWVWVLPE